MGGPRHGPADLPPGKGAGTHRIGGCVGPRAGSDVCGKSLRPPGFDPRTVQPVAILTELSRPHLNHHTLRNFFAGHPIDHEIISTDSLSV